MKRAQTITQIFIYIASAAVFLAILLFGYRAATHLFETQDTVLLADFRADLATKIEQLRVRRGSIDITPFQVPSEYHTICIADSNGQNDLLSTAQFEHAYPQLANAWKTRTENIFLLPKQDIPMYIEHIEIDTEPPAVYICMPIKSQFTLRLEGTGRTVKIRNSSINQ